MQRINLLNALPTDQQQFTVKHFFLVLAAVFICLVLVSGGQWLHILHKYYQLQNEQTKLAQLENEHQKLTQQHPMVAKYPDLTLEVRKQAATLKYVKENFEQLSQQMLREGFFQYLYQIAEVSTSNISLSAISVVKKPENISIEGKARKAQDVSDLVKRLHQLSVFKNITFDKYLFSQEKNYLKFEIATKDFISTKDFMATSQKPSIERTKNLLISNKNKYKD